MLLVTPPPHTRYSTEIMTLSEVVGLGGLIMMAIGPLYRAGERAT